MFFDPLRQNIIIMIIPILTINTVVISIIIVCKNIREVFKTPVTESVHLGEKTAMFIVKQTKLADEVGGFLVSRFLTVRGGYPLCLLMEIFIR